MRLFYGSKSQPVVKIGTKLATKRRAAENYATRTGTVLELACDFGGMNVVYIGTPSDEDFAPPLGADVVVYADIDRCGVHYLAYRIATQRALNAVTISATVQQKPLAILK